MSTYSDRLRANIPWTPDGAFYSRDELAAAMSSHRYKGDPSYRSQVEAKLSRTDTSAWGMIDASAPINFTFNDPSAPMGDGHKW
jgi:hypothetical protein